MIIELEAIGGPHDGATLALRDEHVEAAVVWPFFGGQDGITTQFAIYCREERQLVFKRSYPRKDLAYAWIDGYTGEDRARHDHDDYLRDDENGMASA